MDDITLRQAEALRAAIREVLLKQFDGNLREAADKIGFPTSSFYRYYSPDNAAPAGGLPSVALVKTIAYLEANGHPGLFAELWRSVEKTTPSQ